MGELISMFYNLNLIRLDNGVQYWSTTRYDSQKAWLLSTSTGRAILANIALENSYNIVRCVKR